MVRGPKFLPLAALAVALSASAGARGSGTVPLTASTAGHAEDGALLLRPAPTGRVRIGGGRFMMGSSGQELQAAIGLCQQEPLGAPLAPPSPASTERQSICILRTDLMREAPLHEVTLSPFWIDRTEVTVEAYLRCVTVGVCDANDFPRGDARFDQPRFPMTHVSREDAMRFCAWAGGRLPTEAEWELAARGTARRIFPWGTRWNPHLANHGSFAHDPTDASDGYAGLAPVGSFPDGATPEGVLDLAGNVAEWVVDLLDLIKVQAPGSATPDVKIQEYPSTPQVNPVSTAGGVHVARGGSYASAGFSVRTAARWFLENSPREPFIGFRCAQND